MAETEVCQVFVADFVSAVDPHLGNILAKVLRFYMKVSFMKCSFLIISVFAV